MSSLLSRTAYAYQWIDQYLAGIADGQWDETPANLETNLTWQVGHLTLSAYYHSIMVITGHQAHILNDFPIAEYSKLFHRGAARNAIGSFSPNTLRDHWQLICKASLATLEEITDKELLEPLVEQPYPHPIATIKEEALEWNVLHNHYHWGQIGMIRRALLNSPYDYWSGK